VSQPVTLSIVMPAYNEEEKIADAISVTCDHLNGLGFEYEVVVVNDGSTDATFNVASREAVKYDRRVKVVGYNRNAGKGHALKYGFSYTSGEVITFLDCDMEINPNQIKRYIEAMKLGDLLIASKWHPESRVEMPFVRKILSHGFNLLVKLLTGIKCYDTQSGLKAFRRRVLEEVLPKMSVKRFAFDVELLTVANLYGFKVVELPISIRMRGLFSFREVCRMLWDILGITYRLRVLKWYDRR